MYLEDYEKKILNLYKEGNYSSKEFGYNLKSQRDATLFCSLYNIVLYVYKHYHQRIIVLIDDYDIPIHYNNFVQDPYETENLIIPLFKTLLENNDLIEKCIFMGCLDMNDDLNLKINYNFYTVFNSSFSSYFGFNDEKVKELLKYYDLED